ncbi:MAG: cysteine hydrolase family protein [Cyanobacteria bacterium P01_C01_bin.89]
MIDLDKTALVLIGFQNDYFADSGLVHSVIDDPCRYTQVINHTTTLIEHWIGTPATIIATPITFTPTYEELVDPVGILKMVQDLNAFQKGTPGAAIIKELAPFREHIVEVTGKRGLNAFADTELDAVLQQKGIQSVVLAGAVTSICIDSTGRSAHERGYQVSILKDCIISRTTLEQEFYVENIFPLYATVAESSQLF